MLKFFIFLNYTTIILKAGLTAAAVVAGATHAIPEAAPAPPAAGEAARVGGAFGRDVAVVSHDALQVAHALVELHRNKQTQVHSPSSHQIIPTVQDISNMR